MSVCIIADTVSIYVSVGIYVYAFVGQYMLVIPFVFVVEVRNASTNKLDNPWLRHEETK